VNSDYRFQANFRAGARIFLFSSYEARLLCTGLKRPDNETDRSSYFLLLVRAHLFSWFFAEVSYSGSEYAWCSCVLF